MFEDEIPDFGEFFQDLNDAEQEFVYVVHFRSLKQNRRGVFYATDEDTALKFCIHYTSVEKFSRELWWMLLIYRELANNIYKRETAYVAGVNQDGLPVEIPPTDYPDELAERLRRAFDISPLLETDARDDSARS
jgi:hypothetical protein